MTHTHTHTHTRARAPTHTHTHTHRSPFPKNPNTPDDAKLQRRSPPSVSPLHTPPPRLTTAHPLSTPPSAHHNPHMQAEVSKSAPLNRRKWLQPSDPGLILGMAPPPTSPQTRHTHQHPSNTTSSPLLQSTGQTLVRQASDSGSSNEGEDPTSLTRRSYINGDPGRASGDDSLLVNSTLSAIHSGKIRRESSGIPTSCGSACPVMLTYTQVSQQESRRKRYVHYNIYTCLNSIVYLLCVDALCSI